MTLKPITKPVERVSFAVWDLEWWPDTMKLRIAGLYDGRRYQVFRGIPALMRALLNPKASGQWYFAHFGGGADLAFLQEWFCEHPEYEVEMCFSGSAAVLVSIKRGRQEWFLVDSFFLMRDSLENIGKSLGQSKLTEGMTKAEKLAVLNGPEPQLIDYNEQDCRVLYSALERFRDELEGLGGELKPTIASCAMTLFRRRFLKTNYRTSEAMNDRFRSGYIASRVEVIRRKVEAPADYYDINSSFPSSMIPPCPGSANYFGTRLPKGGGECFMAEVTVNVPRSFYIPPLPFRAQGRVFFPSGRWTGMMAGPDVRYAEELGCLEAVKVVWGFEERSDLKGYVETIYNLRKAEKDPFRRLVYKYLLNSLYGKFGETPEKESILINPPEPLHSVPGAKMIRPGVWRLRKESRAAHEHVALAAVVTARSRRLITRYLHRASDAYYCDTDSIVTSADLGDSAELGALKREFRVESGYFAAPKMYAINSIVKAKGFPKLDLPDFWRVVEGGAVELQRMARVKEMWGMGQLTPQQLTIAKRVRLTLDKRRFSEDGSSTAYDVSEIPAILGEVPEQVTLFP